MDMSIYYGDIRQLEAEETFWCKMQLLPPERQQKILSYRCREDRLRGLGAGLLLEYGLKQHGLTLLEDTFDVRQIHLKYGESGKPGMEEDMGIYFNLSHSGRFAAAVFADCEAGIDIEQVKKHKIRVAERCFTAEEQRYLQQIQNKKDENPPEMSEISPVDFRFTKLWTRKESFCKAEGSGMRLPLHTIPVLEDVYWGDEDYYFQTFESIPGYLLSVCLTAPESEVFPVEIDLLSIG